MVVKSALQKDVILLLNGLSKIANLILFLIKIIECCLKRETERERQTDRQTDRARERERERERKRERET